MDFPKNLSKFYWGVIKKFPWFFVSMFILMLGIEILNPLVFPFMNKWMFEIFENALTYNNSQILQLLLFTVSLYLVDTLLFLMRNIINGHNRTKIIKRTGAILYERVYDNDTAFFINRPAGQISNKVSEIQNNLFPLTLEFWTGIIGYSVALLIISGVLFKTSVLMGSIVLSVGIIRTVWRIFRQKAINKISKEILDISSKNSGVRTDSFGNAMTVKLFANNNYENNYIWKKQIPEIDLNIRRAYLERVRWIPLDIMWTITRIALLIICLMLIRANDISISDAAFAVASFSSVNNIFASLNKLAQDYSENRAKARHAFNDMILEQKVIDKPNAKNIKIKNPEIVFDNISFDYGDMNVLNNFNLVIKPGEKIGIVGMSGAGKTTLVNLILRMYDVRAGAIKINGTDIRDLRQENLRGQIAFVPQESVLFNRSLLENIKYAKPNASKKQVIIAAKNANIHEFITQLPGGYDTLVGNRGIKLSGGQRQRIAIARTILKDAPILMLDEATSALDSENELFIQAALQKIMIGKTTIAIAHRLSTLRNMDRIIVMDSGKIKESGTHSQLLRKNGIYKKLWSMQTGGFISE